MYTTANKLVSGELKGKDIDSGDILSYVINVAPEYGTAEVNGNYTTYVSDKAGIYNYTVKVRDNHSGEAIGNVTVYVFDAEIEIPDAPSGEEIQDPVNPNNPVNPDLSGETLVLFVGEEKDKVYNVECHRKVAEDHFTICISTTSIFLWDVMKKTIYRPTPSLDHSTIARKAFEERDLLEKSNSLDTNPLSGVSYNHTTGRVSIIK